MDELKVNELRIGNLVYDTKGEIYEISLEALKYISKEKLHQVKPIPLTEEWLEKFGFSLQKQTEFFKLKKFYSKCIFNQNINFTEIIIHLSEGLIFLNNGEEKFCIGKNFKYVHQLQNFYFVLAGEELTT